MFTTGNTNYPRGVYENVNRGPPYPNPSSDPVTRTYGPHGEVVRP